MIELRDIKKIYGENENKVEALKGISIILRDSEFVSILGPSGCGKTTTLNIIGGLDRYSSGDLLIGNKSTKTFKDKDWDEYRNHKVGFVFQSYNLIPHQTVLSNVIMALTIGGVDKDKRKELAIEALTKVGLKKEINKYPRQLSGGQMQRVAIARAIVNKPTILLADEPTGALDSKTSIQVLDILKELSKECLVLMVTHNEDLAKEYSNRIISLCDGEITGDTNPYNPSEQEILSSEIKEITQAKQYQSTKGKMKKVKMPFITALKLSLANLKSKLGRTILTCFAGSIGIIGIALILSVSNGFNEYIDNVESSTLSQYPITLTESTLDMTSLMVSFMAEKNNKTAIDEVEDKMTPKYVMVDLLRNLASASSFNDLTSFKVYLDNNRDKIEENILQISYNYDVNFNIYNKTEYINNGIVKRLNPFDLPDEDENGEPIYLYTEEYNSTAIEEMMSSMAVWSEMYEDDSIIQNQYNLVSGSWPKEYNEVVLVLDEHNQMSDFAVYALGLAEGADQYIIDLFRYVNGETDEDPSEYYKEKYVFDFDELLNHEYYLIPDSLLFEKDIVEDGEIETYSSISNDESKIKALFDSNNENLITLKVSGVIKPNPNSDTHSISGSIGYKKALTDKIIEINNNSEVVNAQLNSEYCLYNYMNLQIKGKKFTSDDALESTVESTINMIKQTGMLSKAITDMLTVDYIKKQILKDFGLINKESPSSISIYPKSFEDKDAIIDFINGYNETLTDEEDEKRITYNDYLGSIMGSVTTIVNAITYVLIAFVSISLIVSSIMIAIITYISVLERTKEIGILRAMGASKMDVRNIFNAETFITGFIAGIIGIVITIILNIPISLIIKNLSGIDKMAVLPVYGGISLVIISFLLSVISGLIPSSYASKCDPVIALRSE